MNSIHLFYTDLNTKFFSLFLQSKFDLGQPGANFELQTEDVYENFELLNSYLLQQSSQKHRFNQPSSPNPT